MGRLWKLCHLLSVHINRKSAERWGGSLLLKLECTVYSIFGVFLWHRDKQGWSHTLNGGVRRAWSSWCLCAGELHCRFISAIGEKASYFLWNKLWWSLQAFSKEYQFVSKLSLSLKARLFQGYVHHFRHTQHTRKLREERGRVGGGFRNERILSFLYTGSPKSNVVHESWRHEIFDLIVPARPRPWLEIDTMLCYIVHHNIAYFVVINVSICNLC